MASPQTKIAYVTLAALTLAVIVLLCVWRFLPNSREALLFTGILSTSVLAMFQRLLSRTGLTVPPPKPTEKSEKEGGSEDTSPATVVSVPPPAPEGASPNVSSVSPTSASEEKKP